jgi:hypothetical protein
VAATALDFTGISLTREEKIQIGVVTLAVVGVVGVTWWWSRGGGSLFGPRASGEGYGLKINPSCSDWSVSNPARLQASFGATVDQEIADGNIDPHSIAQIFIAKVSDGHCRSYPNETQSPKEALLYYTVLRDVLEELVVQRQITEQTFEVKLTEARAWGLQQGLTNPDFDNIEDLIEEE